jgi:hypothetical protein
MVHYTLCALVFPCSPALSSGGDQQNILAYSNEHLDWVACTGQWCAKFGFLLFKLL